LETYEETAVCIGCYALLIATVPLLVTEKCRNFLLFVSLFSIHMNSKSN